MKTSGKVDDRDVKILAGRNLMEAEHFVLVAVNRRNECSVLYSDSVSDVRPLVRRGLRLFNKQHPITLRKKKKRAKP